MPKKIAVTHPGKIGDALWSLPTIRKLCEQHEAVADFYTSSLCRPMKDLVEVQPYIYQMVECAPYNILSIGCGVQPWEMPISELGYVKCYQLGFRGVPDCCIGEWIAYHAGLPMENGSKVMYENIPAFGFDGEYVVLATRGAEFATLFQELAQRCSMPCLEIGIPGQAVGAGRNFTTKSILQMASIISGARAFVGLMSAPLVIANGYPMPKIVPCHGGSGDMRHLMITPQHHYLQHPSSDQILALI